jgi:cytochrome P450
MGTGMRLMLGPLKSLVKFKDARQRAHAYIDFHVRKALEEDKPSALEGSSSSSPLRQSLVHGLALQTDNIEYVRSQILQAMMASQETTAILIANTIFLLARHESHWQELRRMVLESGEGLFTYDRLHDFNYLQDILKECKYRNLPQEG